MKYGPPQQKDNSMTHKREIAPNWWIEYNDIDGGVQIFHGGCHCCGGDSVTIFKDEIEQWFTPHPTPEQE